jgi:hypothetical protein
VRRVVPTLAAFALLATFVGPAAGRSARVIELRVHGTVALTGSNVRCGSGVLKGLTYVDCGIAGPGNEPKKGGFVAVMTADGHVTILDSTTLITVFSRAPSSASVGTPVRPGDTFVLPGTSISCNSSKVSGKPTIICYFVDKGGIVRPGSVSFGISDTVLTTLGWSKMRKVRVLGHWAENG